MHSQSNKIIWFLVGNPGSIASSRIHGLQVHQKLKQLGYHSVLAYTPSVIEEKIPYGEGELKGLRKVFEKEDIAIFQKIKNEINIPLFKDLRELGVKLVLIDCDLPVSFKVAELMDLVICTSKRLSEFYSSNSIRSLYIEDSPESFSPPGEKKSSDKLYCYWFGEGSEEKWKDVQKMRRIIESDNRLARWKLVTISNHPDAEIKWHKNFYKDLLKADAIAIPVFNDSEASRVKSANRLLQAMALSLPVLCSPQPSYLDIIKQNENGIICRTEIDWVNSLIKLQDDGFRSSLGINAYKTAQVYSIEENIQHWIQGMQLDGRYRGADLQEVINDEKKIGDYYFHKLLKENINYWSSVPFTISNALVYLKTRAKILVEKL